MDCSAKQRLLIAMNNAMNVLYKAVERMANLAGENEPDEFVDAQGAVRELRPLAVTARENYENHRREHGC